MTDTDDYITSAFKLGMGALDVWFGVFKGLAASTAEIVNPDDLLLTDNGRRVDVFAEAGGPLCLGWFTTVGPIGPLGPAPPDDADAIAPHQLSMSPSGVVAPPPGTGTNKPPVQKVTVWITDPSALGTAVKDGSHTGGLYLASDLDTPVATFSISVARHKLLNT